MGRLTRSSAGEKLEIIRLVEESALPVKQTLAELDIPRSTFYRWYAQYQQAGYNGLVQSGRGKVRLIHWTEYDPGAYDPAKDQRATVWEAAHHLIERLTNHGENGAARLLVKLKSDNASAARDLAYRLFNISERKDWSDHARDYNALAISWSAISEQAAEIKEDAAKGEATNQLGLFE